ncbi:hypothetical protein [Arthrobacter sp. B3I9]|nr:hypothetical protein [Arthrobacter sp. B3I9]
MAVVFCAPGSAAVSAVLRSVGALTFVPVTVICEPGAAGVVSAGA